MKFSLKLIKIYIDNEFKCIFVFVFLIKFKRYKYVKQTEIIQKTCTIKEYTLIF